MVLRHEVAEGGTAVNTGGQTVQVGPDAATLARQQRDYAAQMAAAMALIGMPPQQQQQAHPDEARRRQQMEQQQQSM